MRYNRDYSKYERLIHERVASWHRSTGLERGELLSVARSAYVEACGTYEPGRGASFATWLRRMADQKIREYGSGRWRRTVPVDPSVLDGLESPRTEWRPEVVGAFRDLLASFSREAGEVAGIILSGPLEAMGVDPELPARKVRGFLFSFLRLKGWSEDKIRETFSEIELRLKGVEL